MDKGILRGPEAGELHEVEAEFGGAPGIVVGYGDIESDLFFIFNGVEGALFMEGDAWDVSFLEYFLEVGDFSLGMGDEPEGVFGCVAVAEASDLAAESRHCVTLSGVEVFDDRGWGDPFKASLRP